MHHALTPPRPVRVLGAVGWLQRLQLKAAECSGWEARRRRGGTVCARVASPSLAAPGVSRRARPDCCTVASVAGMSGVGCERGEAGQSGGFSAWPRFASLDSPSTAAAAPSRSLAHSFRTPHSNANMSDTHQPAEDVAMTDATSTAAPAPAHTDPASSSSATPAASSSSSSSSRPPCDHRRRSLNQATHSLQTISNSVRTNETHTHRERGGGLQGQG